MAGRPRLVFERWTDPVAGERLRDVAELSRLDVAAPATDGWARLERAHGYQVAIRTVCAQVPDGEQWLVGPELLARCPALLAVASAGAGYDVIDLDACTAAGVIACNNSGPGAEAVAEHALAMMLALAKKLVSADRAMRAGTVTDRSRLQGSELLGKTLGVVGLGAIGSRLVELVAPFRMTVLVHDPYADDERAARLGVRLVPLEQLLEQADVVQVTCPLTPETAGMFGSQAFRAMKDTAFFVTTARGQVHDEAALVDALRNGSIAGAGLDVFHTEPVPADHPLLALDNVVASPHTAGITDEATYALAEATADQWRTIFGGLVPPRLLNPAAWPRYQERFEAAFGHRPPDLDSDAPLVAASKE